MEKVTLSVVTALSLFLLTSSVFGYEMADNMIYRWQDEQGVTHYSQQEPYQTDYQLVKMATSVKPDALLSQQNKDKTAGYGVKRCKLAKDQQKLLTGDAELYINANEQGLLRILSADERASQLLLARSLIEQYCPPQL